MEYLLFIIFISFAAGFLWGRHTTKHAFTKVFKMFRDEMHNQYIQCLKANGIKIKPDIPDDSCTDNDNRLAS